MFGKRFTLFTLRGFPVRIDLSWLLIVVLITWSLAVGYFPTAFPELTPATYWAMGLLGALGLFASILLHEFAHAVVAQRHGTPMAGITLFIFGGVAEMQDEPRSPKAEFQVAIAGPVTSILIAGLLLGVAALGARLGWPPVVTGVLGYLGLINGILVLFNLVPAFPLDGGRVLRAGLWAWKKNLRWATRISAQIGGGFGLALIVLGVISIVFGAFIGGLWWILIGLFLRSAAQLSYQQLLVRRALEGEPVARFMTRTLVTAPPNASVAELVENYIYRHHHRLFPVTEADRLVGCVTTEQVRELPRAEWTQRTVRELARPCSAENTIRPDADAVEALAKMRRTGRSRLMVVQEGRLLGTLTLKDLLQFIALKVELEEEQLPGALPG